MKILLNNHELKSLVASYYMNDQIECANEMKKLYKKATDIPESDYCLEIIMRAVMTSQFDHVVIILKFMNQPEYEYRTEHITFNELVQYLL